MGAIIVQMTLTVPAAIFAESFLSFLGLGIQAPFASWESWQTTGRWRFYQAIGGGCFSPLFHFLDDVRV